MAPLDRSLRDEVLRRLEQRPRITLRLRIALVFGVCTLFIAAVTAGSLLLLSRVRTKLHFLEAADACAFEIQEARRYEKNFFLYGTNLHDALDHTYRAHRLLEANAEGVQRVVGADATRRWTASLEQYEALLEQLALSEGGSAQEQDRVRHATEAKLRRFGAEILADASDMTNKERRAMDEILRGASLGALASLGIMLLLVVLLADHLGRHVIRPVDRFVRYVERIAQGDFSPIRPARPYKDEFSTLAVAINRMLEELTARQEQLLQSRKMAALGTLTSGVAHELNNPLNNISLTIETLIDDFDTTDEARKRKLLEEAFTQVQRASATVRNLLDFTRREPPVLTAVSIPDLLETALKLVRNELALAHVEVETHIAPDLPRTHGNPRNLEQVFLNLLLNALQAMPDGGKLTLAATQADTSIQVEVRDSGVGIAEEHLDQIFEPFFTTKEAGAGTGLGLSVSYSIVEKHHGRIEVESQVGKGSTFRVILPVVRASH